MNELKDQLDLIEELLQQLTKRFQSLETKVNKAATPSEIKVPDHTGELKILGEEIARFKHTFSDLSENIRAQLDALNSKITNVPQVVSVKSANPFNIPAKWIAITAGVILLWTTLCTGIAGITWSENKRLNENALKFRMVRQVYPAIAVWADTTYRKDPETAATVTEREEARQELLFKNDSGKKSKSVKERKK